MWPRQVAGVRDKSLAFYGFTVARTIRAACIVRLPAQSQRAQSCPAHLPPERFLPDLVALGLNLDVVRAALTSSGSRGMPAY
jgi:hypothetical protein